MAGRCNQVVWVLVATGGLIYQSHAEADPSISHIDNFAKDLLPILQYIFDSIDRVVGDLRTMQKTLLPSVANADECAVFLQAGNLELRERKCETHSQNNLLRGSDE